MIATLHYDFCDCDPKDPNVKGEAGVAVEV